MVISRFPSVHSGWPGGSGSGSSDRHRSSNAARSQRPTSASWSRQSPARSSPARRPLHRAKSAAPIMPRVSGSRARPVRSSRFASWLRHPRGRRLVTGKTSTQRRQVHANRLADRPVPSRARLPSRSAFQRGLQPLMPRLRMDYRAISLPRPASSAPRTRLPGGGQATAASHDDPRAANGPSGIQSTPA